MKQIDILVQRSRHNANKVISETGIVNKCKQIFGKVVPINETYSKVDPKPNQREFPCPDTGNEDVVDGWRTYGNDVAGNQNTTSECLKHEDTHTTRQTAIEISSPVAAERTKFEGKSSQKDIYVYIDDDNVNSADEVQTVEISQRDIKVCTHLPDGITGTSSVSSSNISLHMLS